jgi:hypothetical protein
MYKCEIKWASGVVRQVETEGTKDEFLCSMFGSERIPMDVTVTDIEPEAVAEPVEQVEEPVMEVIPTEVVITETVAVELSPSPTETVVTQEPQNG